MFDKFEWASELPQISKFLEYAYLEFFYMVTQVEPTDMNDILGLSWTFVTRDSKLTSMQKPLWWHWFVSYEVRHKMKLIIGWDFTVMLSVRLQMTGFCQVV